MEPLESGKNDNFGKFSKFREFPQGILETVDSREFP